MYYLRARLELIKDLSFCGVLILNVELHKKVTTNNYSRNVIRGYFTFVTACFLKAVRIESRVHLN